MKGFDSSHVEQQRVDESVPPPDRSSDPGSGPVPRWLLGARLGFRPHSVFRTFVGIDAELGPALASSDPSSARLPGYSLGVSLGATLGTR